MSVGTSLRGGFEIHSNQCQCAGHKWLVARGRYGALAGRRGGVVQKSLRKQVVLAVLVSRDEKMGGNHMG